VRVAVIGCRRSSGHRSASGRRHADGPHCVPGVRTQAAADADRPRNPEIHPPHHDLCHLSRRAVLRHFAAARSRLPRRRRLPHRHHRSQCPRRSSLHSHRKTQLIVIIIIIIIIIKNEFDYGGTVALLLQDHITMSPCRVKQQEKIFKTGKFSVPAKMRRSMKQPGLAAAESSKPKLRPLEKRDRRSLCGMSTVPAVALLCFESRLEILQWLQFSRLCYWCMGCVWMDALFFDYVVYYMLC